MPYRSMPCTPEAEAAVDVSIGDRDCMLRVDLTLPQAHGPTVWGEVSDCCGQQVEGALVRLLQYTGQCGQPQTLCQTVTDCCGRYEFTLPPGCQGRYRVLAENPSCPAPPPSSHCPPSQGGCISSRLCNCVSYR